MNPIIAQDLGEERHAFREVRVEQPQHYTPRIVTNPKLVIYQQPPSANPYVQREWLWRSQPSRQARPIHVGGLAVANAVHELYGRLAMLRTPIQYTAPA